MYILVAILIFGILIFVHELGHFLAAKAFGVRVNEFSICMGPAIWQKQIGETTYSLRCIPIGGFCAMEGEDEKSTEPGAFTSAKWWKRAIILVAGSAMNFITGLLILAIIFSTVSAFSSPTVTAFFEDCPYEGEEALQVGDTLYEIDGRRVYRYSDVSMLLGRGNSSAHDLIIKRDGKFVELDDFVINPVPYEENGKIVYRYGLYFGAEEKTPGTLLKNTWYTAIDFARMVWMSLEDLISGIISVNDMSGPVGIVSVIAETGSSAQSAGTAARNISYLAAFIAVNLAVMNMLPIPALDGGRVFFLLITALLECLSGKKIDPKYEGYIHAAGMILLLAFIAYVSCRDIWKLFTGV